MMKYISLLACILAMMNVAGAADKEVIFETRSELTSHRPFGHIEDEKLDSFMLGKSFFSKPWVAAPTATTARDGLGPLFNANSCTSCHSYARLRAPLYTPEDGVNRALVFKLSIPSQQAARKPENPNVADPVYGEQIAINGTGNVPFEAETSIQWDTHTEYLVDGTSVELRRPIPVLGKKNYGELDPGTVVSIRFSPVLVGSGLLEQIPENDILKRADPDDKNQDGISGRPNWVYNPKIKKIELGRFAYKASASTIEMQTANAAANDMGLTNSYYPKELCTATQTACLQAPKSTPSPEGDLDLPDNRLEAIVHYLIYMRAPENIALKGPGYALFQSLGCASCHTPIQKTASGQIFQPFTDLLLHDMGEGLADGRPEFEATGSEFRTAELWGLGSKVRARIPLLHDARAQTMTEAIMWHGGEAQAAKEAFSQLPAEERAQLLNFLELL